MSRCTGGKLNAMEIQRGLEESQRGNVGNGRRNKGGEANSSGRGNRSMQAKHHARCMTVDALKRAAPPSRGNGGRAIWRILEES